MLHSCVACFREVRPRQEAVECDWCNKWQHRTCGTGISRLEYREAVRLEVPITFVCKPCLDKENMLESDTEDISGGPTQLELTTDYNNADQYDPPTLELSTEDISGGPPQLELTAATDYVPEQDDPPTLELSVPIKRASQHDNDITGEDFYMPENRDIIVGDPFKRNGQLMSIHAFIEKNGKTKQFPLAFCLMSRRTKNDYISVLQALLRKLDQVAVEGIVLDYETAAWQAVRECIPTAEVKGCAFHWSQAVFRHVQQVGLAETYRKRLGLHNFIRMLLSMQFLPAAHIPKTFESLLPRATTAATLELMAYMKRQWIDNPTFRPEDWSVFKQTVRTNNDVEGWHHRINTKAVTSSLTFYKLVPILRREAELVKVAVESGDLERGSSARTDRLDKSLTVCWERYCSGEWKTSRFLQAVGNLYSVRG